MSAKPICLLVAALMVVLVVLVWVVKISRPSEGMNGAGVVDSNSAIEIAQREAARLGYPVAEMKVDCREVAGHYVVVFLPSGNQLGGDVTVRVNASDGTVLEVMRGQ